MKANNHPIKDLYRMAVFARVVEAGSFTLAAHALGLGKSVVSAHLSSLEQGLGVRLLHRSTRRLHLTDEGRRFYSACQHMLETAAGALSELATTQEQVRGVVRLTASYNLGTTFLPPFLRRFRDRFPHVEIELVLDDGIVNLIEAGYDLALRVSWGRQPNLFGRRLCGIQLTLVAAREYLALRPAPREPAAVGEHPFVAITRLPHPDRLDLRHRDGRKAQVRLTPQVRTNTGIAARELVRAGLGIGLIPDYAIRADLESGALVELLPEWRAPGGHISAVYPHKDHVSARTQRLVELLVDEFHHQFGGRSRGVA